MLADVRSRANDLSLADIVVLEIDDLKQITDIFVAVYNLADLVDEMNDCFGHPISRSRFATEDGDTRSQLLLFFWRHGFDCEVPMDDTENVQLLPLVFVNTLHLNIKEGGRVDADVEGVLCSSTSYPDISKSSMTST